MLWLLQAVWLVCCVAIGCFGYGADSDTWLTAHTALKLWKTGMYIPSRGIGNPLFEWLWSPLIIAGGNHLANFFVSLSGLLLWKGLLRVANTMQFKYTVEGVSLIMFTPLVLCNSASTIDYIPALAAWVWAINYRNKPFILYALLLIMVGFRPSWVLLYLLTPLIASGLKLKWYATAALLPVILFVSYLEVFDGSLSQIPLPNLSLTNHLALAAHNGLSSIGIFGFLGIMLLVLSRKNGTLKLQGAIPKSWITITITLFLLQYLIFPYESAYLLPVILLLWVSFPWSDSARLVLRMALLLVLSFHFVQLHWLGGSSGQRHIQFHFDYGYTIRHIEDRLWKAEVRKAINSYTSIKPECLIFGATWIPVANPSWVQINDKLFQKSGCDLYIAEKLYTQEDIDLLKKRGITPILIEQEVWDYIPLFENETLDRADFVFFKTVDQYLSTNIKGRPLNQY